MNIDLEPIKTSRGSSALIIVLILSVLGLGIVIGFGKRSVNSSHVLSILVDSKDANLQMESGIDKARAKMKRAIQGVRLVGKLPFLNNSLSDEEFASLNAAYGTDATTALEFLKDSIEAQAYNGLGEKNSSHEFANFDCTSAQTCAFPTTWTDPDPTDDDYYEYRVSFTAKDPISTTTPTDRLIFEYYFTLESRAYGRSEYSEAMAVENGMFTLDLLMAPFSQFALFRSQFTNSNGLILVFAGGDTASQIQEVFKGPVHMNSQPFFFGSPSFLGDFSSTEAVADWWQGTATDYSDSADFQGETYGSVSSIILPTEMGNTIRLAAGDTSSTAATDTSDVSVAQIASWLQNHTRGTITGSPSSIANGVYLSTDGGASPAARGGIYVSGDARITLNVVQGSSDFSSDYWANIDASHQACKFQKISITHLDPSVDVRDIYVGDDPCNVTYDFDANNPTDVPVVMAGRINGNVYVDGSIDEIGGESRTRPAVATDFGFNFVAKKDVRVVSDLQYEDVEYTELDGDGNVGTDVVANAYGELNSSGILPTESNIVPKMDIESQTVLGLVSVSRSVYIHLNAPDNINIHAAVYAGESTGYDASTDLGCGVEGSGYEGCGFGYEGWDIATGKGNLKLLGGVTEYRAQTLGKLSSPPTGYGRRLAYDERFLESLQPPGFPTSTKLQSYPVFTKFRSWKVSSN